MGNATPREANNRTSATPNCGITRSPSAPRLRSDISGNTLNKTSSTSQVTVKANHEATRAVADQGPTFSTQWSRLFAELLRQMRLGSISFSAENCRQGHHV
eukprot:TRINITY_DN49571_c0_g1_i1.p2 TRINITY_DN49571_c0_g1~~TRINITY_DN49571_c0_g1_i1.p2  ORF type:complete len:101 (+),score=3.94 TRINITY_DN49571_c0_g1_i1:439-741(+)